MAVYRTPLGRARGLGSAGHGTSSFVIQRVSAAALIVLVLWGVWSALVLARGDYITAITWLHSPVNAAGAVLLALAGFWHMQIGMQTIVEDYFQRAGIKALLLIGNTFVCFAGAALSVICLLKVAFGGGSV